MDERRVIVQLHAQAVDLAGGRETGVRVGPAATCADLKRALASLHPGLAGLLRPGDSVSAIAVIDPSGLGGMGFDRGIRSWWPQSASAAFQPPG